MSVRGIKRIGLPLGLAVRSKAIGIKAAFDGTVVAFVKHPQFGPVVVRDDADGTEWMRDVSELRPASHKNLSTPLPRGKSN